MTGAIEVHPDVVKGLVPVLRSPEIFETMHDIAEKENLFFRFAHAAFVATLQTKTQYDSPVIEAISTGVQAYELLAVNAGGANRFLCSLG